MNVEEIGGDTGHIDIDNAGDRNQSEVGGDHYLNDANIDMPSLQPIHHIAMPIIEEKREYVVQREERESKDREVGKVIVNLSWTEALRQGFIIWCIAVSRKILVLMAIIVFLWVYYIPAIVFSPQLLAASEGVLYYSVRYLMASFSFWISLSMVAIELFSTQFSKIALFLLITGSLCETIISSFPNPDSVVLRNLRSINRCIFLTIGLYSVYKSRKPEQMTTEQQGYYNLTKDGSVSALLKGMIAFFVLNLFLFFNIFGMYLKSSFYIRLIFRLIVFPVGLSLSKWIQTTLIHKLPEEHMDRRLVVNKFSNHYAQLLGRVLVSNISMDGALSYKFITVNILVSLVKIMFTLSYDYRIIFMYRVQTNSLKIYSQILCRCKPRKLVPIVPEEASSNPSTTENSDKEGGTSISDEDKYLKESISFQTRYVFDDITSELYSIALVPLLMYFVHPLVRSPSFKMIDSFIECICQIIIQIVFGVLSNAISLSFELRWSRLNPGDINGWKPMKSTLLFTWSFFCAMGLHWGLVFYS